jgi:DHA2 family multidrug resistance protein
VGQSFALSGMVFIGVLNLRLEDALTFGAMLQTARLFGGEVGTAFIATLARIREQRASNIIGQHAQAGALDVQHRLQIYAHVLARGDHPASASPALLANVIRTVATTQATIDSFVGVAAVAAFGLFVLAILLPPPPRTPASYVPLFHREPAE